MNARSRLLALLVVVVVLAALVPLRVVMLPILTAAFVGTLSWPLYALLAPRIREGPALGVLVLTVLAVFSAFFGALVWVGRRVAERAPRYRQRMQDLLDAAGAWAEENGVDLQVVDNLETVTGAVLQALSITWSAGAGFLLMMAFLILGVREVETFRAKLLQWKGARGDELTERLATVGQKLRGYMLALGISGAISGTVTVLFSWVIGLEFALLWGLLALLLNFVPVLGSAIAVVPPAFFAFVQFEGLALPLAALAAFSLIQFVTGNYIAPRLEARYTQVSPLVVLLVIVFWGWMWGPVGAFLGVPLTIAIAIGCREHESTRWISRLLTDEHDAEQSHLGGRRSPRH